MDVRNICGEDSIFPLSTDYNNKTQYALIAQSVERILGNYRMDVRNICGEDSIFPLSTDYNNKTQYALIAQSAERVRIFTFL